MTKHTMPGGGAGDDCCAAKRLWRRIAWVSLLLLSGAIPRMASAQTPSPLQEWQYPGGTILYQMFEPNLPEWRVILGAAVQTSPLYDGAQPYRERIGPVVDIRYRDIAFASVGEGVGVNLVRGMNYRAGVSIGYDLGRQASDDLSHLRGLGDIAPGAVVKAFGSYVVSKEFPLALRADVRQFVGGADGALIDLAAFVPLPGSSKSWVMLAGPSITWADRLYMQKEFGVTPQQAPGSRYRPYGAHGGSEAAGLGFSATRFITEHWLFNANAAVNRLLGAATDSPIIGRTTQGELALTVAYRW